MIRFNLRKIVVFTILISCITAGMALFSGRTSAVPQVTITTETLTITGAPSTFNPKPFSPVTIQTDKLTITGLTK